MCLSSPEYRSRQAKIYDGSLFDKQPAAVGGDVDRDVLQSVCFVGEKDVRVIQPPVPDPARVHLDEHTTILVTESLCLLGNFDVDVRTHGDATQYDAARQHIDWVVEFVSGTVDELHGKESEEAAYARANGKRELPRQSGDKCFKDGWRQRAGGLLLGRWKKRGIEPQPQQMIIYRKSPHCGRL
jgi:hypothetical protein